MTEIATLFPERYDKIVIAQEIRRLSAHLCGHTYSTTWEKPCNRGRGLVYNYDIAKLCCKGLLYGSTRCAPEKLATEDTAIMLHYRIEGSGPPLLLIHGWGVTFAIWQNLAPLLRSHFQLIMIELPGIGGSPMVDPRKLYYPACAEAIEEVRTTLGIERWSLLAYSSGTRAAEAYIQRYPNAIDRAVFLCPVYLQEIWSFFLRLLNAPHPQTLTQWVLSDWRLHNLIRALGFNGKRHDYTHVWKNEIELQPVKTLIRSLSEIPGSGRSPFSLPEVPSVFIWGRQDVLTARPRRLRPNDILIPADHSAPMLAAPIVAEIVLPFISSGELVTPAVPSPPRRQRLWLRRRDNDKKKKGTEKNRIRLRNLLRKLERRRTLRRTQQAQVRRRTQPLR